MLQKYPLGLPRGSIRAIVTLIFSISVVVGAFLRDTEMLKMLIPVATYTIGQYFGTRSSFINDKDN